MKNSKEDKTSSFDEIRVMFVVFTVIFVILVLFVFIYFLRRPAATDIEFLLTMQGVTLAVSAISITLVGFITSVAMAYRERKMEENQKRATALMDELSELKKKNEELNVLYSLYLATASQNLFFYDILKKAIDSATEYTKNGIDQTSLHWIHGIIAFLESRKGEHECGYTDTERYKMIIRFSEAIINSKELSAEEKIFAYLHISNAHYRIFRIKFEHISIRNSSDSLLSAQRYIHEIEGIIATYPSQMINSSFYNLSGLIYYWLYKAREKEGSKKKIIEDPQELLAESSRYYLAALDLHESKNYHNNYGVAHFGYAKFLYNLNKIEKGSLCKSPIDDSFISMENKIREAEKEFKNAIKIDSTYSKPYLNLADLAIYKIKIEYSTNKTTIIFTEELCSPVKTSFNESNPLVVLEEAKANLLKAIEYDPNFPNNYYKMAEVYIWELFLAILDKKEEADYVEVENNIKKHLAEAHNKKNQHTSVLRVERQYYELIKDYERAEKINDELANIDRYETEDWTLRLKIAIETEAKSSD